MIQMLHALCNYYFDLGSLARKCKRGEEVDLEETTAVALCEIDRTGDKGSDNSNALSTNLHSLTMLYKDPITKENNVVAAALLPSAATSVKISVPADELSAPTFTTQCSLTATLVGPAKKNLALFLACLFCGL